jgi:hypothetical protein
MKIKKTEIINTHTKGRILPLFFLKEKQHLQLIKQKVTTSLSNSNSNILVKRKLDELSKIPNENAPISNTDISKRDRELYVGNLPSGLTPEDVTQLMNAAMVSIGGNVKSGNPILSSWVNPDQDYALLEFRTPEEAINSFKLDGLTLFGKVRHNLYKTGYKNW